MNPIRALVEHLADRIHEPGDQAAEGLGLTVERLSWGRRRVSDPRLPQMLEHRRKRALRDGLDPIDRALLDPAAVARLTHPRRRPLYGQVASGAAVRRRPPLAKPTGM